MDHLWLTRSVRWRESLVYSTCYFTKQQTIANTENCITKCIRHYDIVIVSQKKLREKSDDVSTHLVYSYNKRFNENSNFPVHVGAFQTSVGSLHIELQFYR